ncbi:hypothetical protein RI367_002982 [Sorochytrium milnesiophthora]
MATVQKKAKLNAALITHNGTFHADEVLACWMLKQLPRYADAEIIRTRDANLIQHYGRGTGNAGDNVVDSGVRDVVVVDVGAVYVPSEQRFDHHQREFVDTFSPNYKIRLSSAVLIYKHFGRELIAHILSWPIDDDRVGLLHEKIYENIILTFDGVDNGVPQFPPDVQATAAYKDATTLSHIVSRLNPFWNEENVDVMSRFNEAMAVCGNHLLRNIQYYGTAWLPVRDTVRAALTQRHQHDSSGRIVVFESYVPWKDHLADLERELGITTESPDLPYYVLFPDPSNTWRIQAISIQPDSFISRRPLPAAWRGVRDAQLDAVIWPEPATREKWQGSVFIHASGFIGGHKTREGVLEMARLALHTTD